MRFLAGLLIVLLCVDRGYAQPVGLDPRFVVGDLLFSDDFKKGTDRWVAELEKGGRIEARDGKLEIDVPGGCALWFKQPMDGPVLIEYDATVISAGGPNDRVSDLNCFWMATDPRSPANLLDVKRSGKFEDYNQLRCYYVGFGGNTNMTTRFRRYIGSPTTRPILPEHDLTAPLLVANAKQRIQLVAAGNLVQYFHNGRKLFELTDPEPYQKGWFALRTVTNHMVIENFSIRRLRTPPTTQQKP